MMMTTFKLAWIFVHLFIIEHVCCKVVTVNTTGGSDNTTCCVDGQCPCSSLSTVLLNITSNTVINVTSEIVPLLASIQMGLGQGRLNAITITSNGTTIVCNNTSSISCR